MSISVEYKGCEFEFDSIPSDEELERRYQERMEEDEEESDEPDADALVERAYGDEAPLPSGARRMWYLQQSNRDSPAFNLGVCLQFEGAVDPDLLRETFETLVERHEVLRTVFPLRDGAPIQKIRGPDAPLDWTFRDVSGEDDPEERARGLVEEAYRRPFELTEKPPIRLLLVRVSADKHLLGVVYHHISMDKFCARALIGEFAELYTANREGREPRLGDVSLQFGDYAIWQRHRLESDAYDEGIDFWVEYLEGAEEEIDWPHGGDSTATERPTGLVEFEWSEDVSRDVRELGESLGVRSEFLLLAALYAAFLGRYSGQSDLTVGLEMAIAARRRSELRRTMGYMLNVIPLRAALDPKASLGDWLVSAWGRWAEMLNYQWIPLHKIVDAVGAKRRPGKRPLFDTVFTYTPRDVDPARVLEERGMQLLDFGVKPPAARSTLELEMWKHDGLFDGHFIYDRSKFTEEQIEQLVDRFRTFVRDAAARPDEPLEALDAAAPDEAPERADAGREAKLASPAAADEPGGDPVEPEPGVVEAVESIWRNVLETDRLEEGVGFFEAGGSSIDAVRLRAALEREFEIECEVVEILANQTVRELARLVQRRLPSERA